LTFHALKRDLIAAGAAAIVAFAAQGAFAASTVNVQLMDKGIETGMATGITYGTPGVDTSKSTDMLKLSQTSVPAGAITFNVTNMSKEVIHEMIVVPVTPGKPLPYLAGQQKVDETKIKSLGEVSELDPGKIGKVTLNLAKGTYLLLCNQAGHYAAGMWAVFTVS
jgi:uncharacterized cupredoxin-like copper-binding protein